MNILIKFKDLLIETLKDNKKLILTAYAIFLLSFILAAAFTGEAVDNVLNDMPITTNDTMNNGTSATDLFIHNEIAGISTYIESIFFGIMAIVSLIYNGVNLGILGNLLAKLMPKGWIQYIFYLIPHGIFEFSSLILESVAGILLFLFIWNFIKTLIKSDKNGFKEKVLNAYEENKKKLIQSLVLMIFCTILLLIAAPIEAYISIPLSEFIAGI